MRLVGEMLRRIALMPYQADINVKYKMSREKEDKHMDGFEFRDIRSGEADEAILIEQICFPPQKMEKWQAFSMELRQTSLLSGMNFLRISACIMRPEKM